MSLRVLGFLKKLATEPEAAANLARDEALLLVTELNSIRDALESKALGPSPAPQVQSVGSPQDRELTPSDVAERLRVSVRYVYRNANSWPFTRRISRKVIRFS